MEPRWLFTFGLGSPLAKHCVILRAPDEETARWRMVAMFSNHWAHVYPEDKILAVIERNQLAPISHNLETCSVRIGTNPEPLAESVRRVVWP